MSSETEARDSASRRDRPRQLPRVRIGAVLAIAAAVGFLAWLIVRDEDSTSTPQATSPAAPQPPPVTSNVSAISVPGLRNLAASLDQPIYWAGPRGGMKLSVRRNSDGRVYVRYLPRDVRVGDPRPQFLVVATYPVEDAFAATQNAARGSAETTQRIANGGIVYYASGSPTNVYLAYPGEDYQVEVFHPNAETALRLVTSGRIRPVR
jgi:hypothetical protein